MLRQFLPQAFDLVDEIRFKRLGALEKRRLFGIVVAAIVEYFRHVPYELAQFVVALLVYFVLDFLQVCKKGKHKI